MITAVRLPGRHPTRSAKPGPPGEPPKPPASPPTPGWRRWLLPIVLVIVFLVLLMRSQPSPGTSVTYSQFLGKVNTGQVKTVDINDKGAVDGTLKDGRKFTTQIPTALDNSGLEQQLRSEKVDITASNTGGGSGLGTLLAFILPLVLLGALFLWTGRKAARTLSGG